MIDPLLDQLAGRDLVVTATARLARELRQQFDQRQLALGKRAWESADALPYGDFLRRVWQHAGAGGVDCPLLLNQTQMRMAWENIIRDDIRHGQGGDDDGGPAAAPLWNTPATARAALDAWRILHHWRIDLDACGDSSHEDHRRWRRWARRYQQRCAMRNWTDPHCLAKRLIALLGDPQPAAQLTAQLPGKIVFAGFDRLLPQQRALIAALQAAGIEVEIPAIAETTGAANRRVDRHDFENPPAQYLSAARWARQKLLDNPQAKIAIVAPNLDKSAAAIERALQQILSPRQLLAPALGADLPYHSSLGKKLIHHPVAGAALAVLAPLAGRPLSAAAIGGLLNSRFIRGADSEAATRDPLAMWRRRLPPEMSLPRLLKALSRVDGHRPPPACPILLRSLTAALPLLQESGHAKPASHWARRFSEWLEHLGWPGERPLDSDEFQAADAFRRQLRDLASLDLAAAPMTMSAANALSRLRRQVAEQAFQVEAGGAPVQVIGVLEAAGLRFDALWFGGLVATDWPPTMRINPFIAAAVQRRAGVIEASIELNFEHAAALQRRLIASAAEVVLSRPRLEDDIPAEPSPLLTAMETEGGFDNRRHSAAEELQFDTPDSLLHAARPALESIIDTAAPALAMRAGGPAKGGIAVIENQAKCPFRAFAIHRLGAAETEQNEQGLAATERGALIHRALQLVWQSMGSSRKLRDLRAEELDAIILAAAEQAGRRHQATSGCGAVFQQTQTRWAANTLREWLGVEKRRAQPFVVAALEQESQINLAGLRLAFKIDRMDTLSNGAESGALALIDYKTGAPGGLRQWSGARPPAPQLPLYALAQTAPVSTVAFARVSSGDCGFSGVTREAEFDSHAPRAVAALENSALKNDFADWPSLIEHWRESLTRLAEEFLGGEARVDPLNSNVCAWCDLHGFCRIDAAADGVDGDGEEAAPPLAAP